MFTLTKLYILVQLYIYLVIIAGVRGYSVDNLIDLLKGLLKKDFNQVLSEVPVLDKEADLIFFEKGHLNAIVVKSKISEIPDAVGPCSYFRQSLHKTYLALPEKELQKITNEKIILKEMGIGLISFSRHGYDIVLEPKESKPDAALLETIKSSLNNITKIKDAAEIYKALSHPTRLTVYLTVCRGGSVKLKDIAKKCCDCYPLLMKHIKILEESNLIESQRSGKETTLKLKSSPVNIADMISDEK